MIDYYAIGQRIRQIRKARGLSQDQLAEQVGISTVHVSHIENANTKLSLPVFVRLTEVLQVPADELLQGAAPVRRLYYPYVADRKMLTGRRKFCEKIMPVGRVMLERYILRRGIIYIGQ